MLNIILKRSISFPVMIKLTEKLDYASLTGSHAERYVNQSLSQSLKHICFHCPKFRQHCQYRAKTHKVKTLKSVRFYSFVLHIITSQS